jgi:hypothetical protein
VFLVVLVAGNDQRFWEKRFSHGGAEEGRTFTFFFSVSSVPLCEILRKEPRFGRFGRLSDRSLHLPKCPLGPGALLGEEASHGGAEEGRKEADGRGVRRGCAFGRLRHRGAEEEDFYPLLLCVLCASV